MNDEALVSRLRDELDDGGLRGSFLVRDLRTRREISIDPDLEFPSDSLVKVPLAAATLDRIRRGELDGSTQIDVQPGRVTASGPTGLAKFRHPARVAIDDLLYLMLAISDGVAADTLFDLTPPAEVTRITRDWGVRGINVRHPVGELINTPAERFAHAEVHLVSAPPLGHWLGRVDHSDHGRQAIRPRRPPHPQTTWSASGGTAGSFRS